MSTEDLQQIAALMDAKLEPITARLDGMDKRLDKMQAQLDEMAETLDEVREDGQITRSACNDLLDWADHVAIVTAVQFPVKKSEKSG